MVPVTGRRGDLDTSPDLGKHPDVTIAGAAVQASRFLGRVSEETRSWGTPGTSPELGERPDPEKIWLVEMFRADKDLASIELFHGPLDLPVDRGSEGSRPACRCYRCGQLLTMATVRVHRQRSFGGSQLVRPACQGCWAP